MDIQKAKAEEFLKQFFCNERASFRSGQWEAIEGLVSQRKKLLVVEKTGWGKSMVYFLATKLLREMGAGPTIVISPLLALMRNQIESAQKLGISIDSINSTNEGEWGKIQNKILEDSLDLLLISPERLANEDFLKNVLLPISNRLGLLVVDEAHCISDWGHDFRPDYRRIVEILKYIPQRTPVLATTATANHRVIQDIQNQIPQIDVQRGPLVRETLHLQNIILLDYPSRLAWLAENLPKLPGTGIIYTLTIRDAERVAKWLQMHQIQALPYYGDITAPGFPNKNSYRKHLEQQLLNNEIKALVATVALGMGFDKPDLGFVVHFQAPGSVVSYYQQVGRAGRAIDKAYGILLSGKEDGEIHQYFRQRAFPEERHVVAVLSVLEDAEDGLSRREIESKINLRSKYIKKILKYLSVETPAPVVKATKWYRTPNAYALDREKIHRLTGQREKEWHEVLDYIHTETCLMEFLQKNLDDPHARPCGHCARCLKGDFFPSDPSRVEVAKAVDMLKHSEMIIKPRKQIPTGAFRVYSWLETSSNKNVQFQNLPSDLQFKEGRALSLWNDKGFGQWVAEDKRKGRFREELVEAMARMIEDRWKPNPFPTWLTVVPSLNHLDLVPHFGRRLAKRLKIQFVEVVHKKKGHSSSKRPGQQLSPGQKSRWGL